MGRPLETFHDPNYLRINKSRFEHFDWMGLDVAGKSVLEVGAGIGDHTLFLSERGATVTPLEAREENLEIIRFRFPDLTTIKTDLDNEEHLKALASKFTFKFDMVYAYGILYHLTQPEPALDFFRVMSDLLVMDTCVVKTTLEDDTVEYRPEDREQSHFGIHGLGMWPGYAWLMEQIRKRWAHVYFPTMIPSHPAFVENWDKLSEHPHEARLVLVASASELDSDRLTKEPRRVNTRLPE